MIFESSDKIVPSTSTRLRAPCNYFNIDIVVKTRHGNKKGGVGCP